MSLADSHQPKSLFIHFHGRSLLPGSIFPRVRARGREARQEIQGYVLSISQALEAPGWTPTNSLGAPCPAPQAPPAHQLGSVKWAFYVLSPQSVTLLLLERGGAVGGSARG